MNKKVLVIDDEIARIDDSQIFCNRFALRGYEYLFAKDERRAYSKLENNDISLILLDIIFKGIGDRHGIQILKGLSEKYPKIPVVMLSSRTEPETLVQCWDLGAKSYIIKWPSLEELQDKLNKYSRYIPKEQLIGNSPTMRRLKEKIGTIAKTDATVLIQGETGTGKEVIARMIHETSYRRDSPFEPVDCT
ncbi:MAG: sigma-54-dependent transcriptional regulator, partial [Candidatus Poribacteria bacterium]